MGVAAALKMLLDRDGHGCCGWLVFRMALWRAVVFVWRVGRVMDAWGRKGDRVSGIIIADRMPDEMF